MHPLPQDLDLGTPERGLEGGQLAIDIGFRHVVQIDQGEPPDSAAGQGLDRPGPYAAHPDDYGVCSADTLEAPLTIEPTDARKTPLCHLP